MRNPINSGWHLMMDAIVEDPTRISDSEGLKAFILDLVQFLKMDILEGPRMSAVEIDVSRLDTDSDEGGITGYCLITTSHVSIHTWPLRQRFCLDVFSCKEFDAAGAADLIRERLGVTQDTTQQVARTWPDAPSVAGSPSIEAVGRPGATVG